MTDPRDTAYFEAVDKLEAHDRIYRLIRDEHEEAVRVRDVARDNFRAAQIRISNMVNGRGIERIGAMADAVDVLTDMAYEFAVAADALLMVEVRMEEAEIATQEAHNKLTALSQ